MFSSELPGGVPQCWIAHLWIEVWPLESDGKQSEVDHRGKACIASPKQIRKRPIPGTRGSRRDRMAEICPNDAQSPQPRLKSGQSFTATQKRTRLLKDLLFLD